MEFLREILGGLMRFIYETLSGLGASNEPALISYYAISILIMAILYRLIILPITLKSSQSSEKMKEIAPKIQELKRKYGYDSTILQQKTSELYKKEKVGAVQGSSCLLMILQIFISLVLYNVISSPGKYMLKNLSAEQIKDISKHFLWISNLELKDITLFLPIINSISQLLYSKISMLGQYQSDEQKSSQNMMMIIMPLFLFFIFKELPSGIVLYWTVGNFIDIIFRLIIFKFGNRKGVLNNETSGKES